MTVIPFHKPNKKVPGGFGNKKQPQNPSRDEIHLVRFADKLDDIILEYVLEHSLPPAEVAALVAHRLGNFLAAMPYLPGSESVEQKRVLEYLLDVICRQSKIDINIKVG